MKKEGIDLLFHSGTRRFLRAMLHSIDNIENDNYKTSSSVVNRMEHPTSTTVARKADLTYSHTVRLRKMLGSRGLLEIEDKTGRIKPIQLTEKGRQIAKLFEEIYRLAE